MLGLPSPSCPPMTHLVVFQHLEREGPGRFGEEARRRGWTVTVCRPDRGEPMPRLGPDQALLVLGGPMGVGDIGSPAFPWLEEEVALLRECLACERPVVGLCLGAQLLAFAAGGQVAPLTAGEPPVRAYEVGWGPVTWTRPPGQEPVLAGLHPCEPVFFWHGDRVRLPATAVLVGSSLACREQAFRIGPRAWGLQFHAEITPALARSWVASVPEFVRLSHGPEGVERLLADLERWGESLEARNRLLLGNLLDALAEGL